MEEYQQTLRVLQLSAWPALAANLTPEVVAAMILYRTDVIECRELEEREYELEDYEYREIQIARREKLMKEHLRALKGLIGE
jgi:hypothetical protein